MNYRTLMAIKQANLRKIQNASPDKITSKSGIYRFTRTDENGILWTYVGQAEHFDDRMPAHLTSYSPFDLSLKRHSLFEEHTNPHGYIPYIVEECSIEDLDAREQYWIVYYGTHNHNLKNITMGGQDDKGKYIETRSPKTYTEGKTYGYSKCISDIKKLLKNIDINLVPKNRFGINALEKLKVMFKENEDK